MVILACMTNGAKLEPFVIFKEKTRPREKFPAGIVLTVYPNGCCD